MKTVYIQTETTASKISTQKQAAKKTIRHSSPSTVRSIKNRNSECTWDGTP
ncbi:hypothetical protein [Endozoicomonas numazuensis]|uniref:hypothetical protein n=1 Tax=Endozoicomonas numazuensis TaxID=1137799 RepID=UPI000B0A3D29|nr:hypothetical protein [Endozoicomonas numazuensis]